MRTSPASPIHFDATLSYGIQGEILGPPPGMFGCKQPKSVQELLAIFHRKAALQPVTVEADTIQNRRHEDFKVGSTQYVVVPSEKHVFLESNSVNGTVHTICAHMVAAFNFAVTAGSDLQLAYDKLLDALAGLCDASN
eukprot:8154894-Karenia_brevis.AAC.1